MGLFSKEPAEKKAYWKAFDAMLSKPNEKTFAAMEAASMNWPSGWQGHLFMGLCYDLASCKMPFAPDKADICHSKAKEAGKKAGCKWLDNFYGTFDEAAGNFRMKEDYYPRVEYIRKAGVAMLQWNRLEQNHIFPEKGSKDDVDFWYPLFMGIDTGSSGFFKKSTDEQNECLLHESCFSSYVTACLSYRSSMRDDVVKMGNSIIDDANELSKKHEAEADAFYSRTRDTAAFVNGYAHLIGGGPFVDVLPDLSRKKGWNLIWMSADKGCMSALHFLADLFNSDCRQEVCDSHAYFYRSSSDPQAVAHQLIDLLELSAKKGDPGALHRAKALADDRR